MGRVILRDDVLEMIFQDCERELKGISLRRLRGSEQKD